MADDTNRKPMPDLLQTTLAMSFGVAFKGLEAGADLMRNPPEAMSRLANEVQSLITVPAGAGDGLPGRAQAMAGVWMEKSATFMAECMAAGEKLTEKK